jgi:hypothetical protein
MMQFIISKCTKGENVATKMIVAFLILVMTISGCNMDVISNDNSSVPDNSPTMSGAAIVEGYVGYFSPALPPSDRVEAEPSGYVLSNDVWRTETPQCSYSRIYLEGKESQLSRAVHIQVTGTWRTWTLSINDQEHHYLKISVDSLQVIN